MSSNIDSRERPAYAPGTAVEHTSRLQQSNKVRPDRRRGREFHNFVNFILFILRFKPHTRSDAEYGAMQTVFFFDNDSRRSDAKGAISQVPETARENTAWLLLHRSAFFHDILRVPLSEHGNGCRRNPDGGAMVYFM